MDKAELIEFLKEKLKGEMLIIDLREILNKDPFFARVVRERYGTVDTEKISEFSIRFIVTELLSILSDGSTDI